MDPWAQGSVNLAYSVSSRLVRGSWGGRERQRVTETHTQREKPHMHEHT